MIKLVFLILLGIAAISLPSIQKSNLNNVKNEQFFEIKYEDLLKQKKSIKLSQLATDIEYIRLETNKNCLINDNAKYYFSGDYIFVSNRDHILKFSSDGKFIKKIGSHGRGPGEIFSIRYLSIIPEKKLIIIHDGAPKKLLYFDFNGKLIKVQNIPRFEYVRVIDDNKYIAISQAIVSSEKFTHLLIDESGDTLSTIRNNVSWKTKSSKITGLSSPSFIPFYSYQSKFYLKSLYNDTVYVVFDNKIKPSYFINLGKYKLPEEKIFERLSPEESRLFQHSNIDYCFAYVFEAGDKLFIIFDGYGVNNKKVERYIIEKRDLVINSDRYSGVYKGWIENDWDGGTLFWPKGSITDNKVFMPIYVEDLKNILNFRRSSNALKTIVKFPDKRIQLEKIASELDITDNPILMIVTLKSNYYQ